MGFLSSGLVVKSPQRESTFRQLDQNSGPGDPGLLCAGLQRKEQSAFAVTCLHPFRQDLAFLVPQGGGLFHPPQAEFSKILFDRQSVSKKLTNIAGCKLSGMQNSSSLIKRSLSKQLYPKNSPAVLTSRGRGEQSILT